MLFIPKHIVNLRQHFCRGQIDMYHPAESPEHCLRVGDTSNASDPARSGITLSQIKEDDYYESYRFLSAYLVYLDNAVPESAADASAGR